jgi:hypothetical protein
MHVRAQAGAGKKLAYCCLPLRSAGIRKEVVLAAGDTRWSDAELRKLRGLISSSHSERSGV